MDGLTSSIVICCYSFDRLPDTLAAVHSALDQSVVPDEIIVSVDHNPQLGGELRALVPARVVFVANDSERGESATRNAGIRKASGDIIAFLDDDAVAQPDWFENLLAAFRNPAVMVVGGQSLPAWESGAAPLWFPPEFEFVVGCTGHTDLIVADDGQIRNVTGSNMAVRREAFEKVGGWERALGRGQVKTGGGEAELCMRIKSAFPRSLILHERSAVVHHKVPRERSTLRYVLPYAYNEGIVRAKLRKYALCHTGRPLAGERLFLRRILGTAIPTRLKRLYRLDALAQLAIILANTILVVLGYIRGRMIYRYEKT